MAIGRDDDVTVPGGATLGDVIGPALGCCGCCGWWVYGFCEGVAFALLRLMAAEV